jgi:hypothetical protein
MTSDTPEEHRRRRSDRPYRVGFSQWPMADQLRELLLDLANEGIS